MSSEYDLVRPPFTKLLREMSKQELRSYREWYVASVPARIEELASAVRRTPGFEQWRPDLTAGSLSVLGRWFASAVELRPLTASEAEKLESNSVFPADLPREGLTNRSYSIAFDVAIYFGETLLREFPTLTYHQRATTLRFADYGHVVLKGRSRALLNPLRSMVGLALSIGRGRRTGDRLRVLFDNWVSVLQP